MLKQEDITLEIDTNARYCRNITLLHYKSVIFAIAKDMKSNYHVSYIFTDMDLDIYKDSLKERIQKFSIYLIHWKKIKTTTLLQMVNILSILRKPKN